MMTVPNEGDPHTTQDDALSQTDSVLMFLKNAELLKGEGSLFGRNHSGAKRTIFTYS